MKAPEWYRNNSWNAEVSAAFESKLRRAKRKEQFLRIQASTLAHTFPKVAHSLLDRYFALPDDFDHAQAYVDRASAFLAEGKLAEAVASYEAALARERVFPKLLTQAYLELPYLIATLRVQQKYSRAQKLLDFHQSRLMLPVDYFKSNTAHALISQALGEPARARVFAQAALAAAAKESSGLQHHPQLGLVNASFSEVEAQLRRLRDA